MKIAISVLGRFWAFELAQQMEKRGRLQQLMTSLPRFVAGKFGVPRSKICSYVTLEVARRAWERMPRPVRNMWNTQAMFSLAYDRFAARNLCDEADIFVAWSGSALQSMRRAKQQGMVCILERGSSHMLYQQEVLVEQYRQAGLEFTETHPKVIEQELAECPVTQAGIGVDVAGPPGIGKGAAPVAGQGLVGVEAHVVIVVAADENRREGQACARHGGKAGDAGIIEPVIDLGRGDEEGGADFPGMERAGRERAGMEGAGMGGGSGIGRVGGARLFELCPPRDGQTAERMGDEDHRPVCRADGEVQLVHPGVAVGRVPHAEVHALAIVALLFPQGLPVAGAAVVEAGHGEDQGFDRGWMGLSHGHRMPFCAGVLPVRGAARALHVALFITQLLW